MSLGETGRLRVPWGPGVDTKFFPGLSILFALPVKLLGITAGWLFVESACFAGAAWLTGALARRLGLSAAGAAVAAALFAVDPLIIKWASVPYAEVPALFFTLASIEFAFRARDGERRRGGELLAALALGVAGTMRLEAFVAAPAFLAIVVSGRAFGRAAASAASTAFIMILPIVAHLSVMASLGTGPSKLHYVTEFFNNFSWERYQNNLLTFAQESVYIIPKSKELLTAGFGGFETFIFGAARAAAAAATIAGAILLIFGRRRFAAIFACGLFIFFALAHGLWHYSDARFLVIVWPVHAAAAAAAFDWMICEFAPRRPNFERILQISGFVILAFVAGGFLYSANGVAAAHGAQWEQTTGGSAREFADRIDKLVSPSAEGFYQLEMDFRPIVAAGPFVAMYRRAPAQFCYSLTNFFEPHVLPAAVPEMLKAGDRFVVTNLPMEEWLRRYAPDPLQRAGYRPLLEERGRTVIVYRPK